MNIVGLFILMVVAALVAAFFVWWRHYRHEQRERRRAIDEYLGSVPHRLTKPMGRPVVRAPHPQSQDETRQLPAIRDGRDHIHTPTPIHSLPTQERTMATFDDGDSPNNIMNASDLGPPPAISSRDLPPQSLGKGDMGLPADMPMAPSSSVNDFHTWREQDQAVAQLASQLAELDGDPWEVKELEMEQAQAPISSQYWIGNYYDQRKSLIMNLANQLNKLSAPLATYLESAAVTVGGPGKVPCVKAGNRTICGATPADARQLNADVITITAPVRIQILADLNSYGKTGVFPEAAGKRYWTAQVSNQLCLFFSTAAEAKEYADKLNASYHAVAAKPRAAILAELADVTDPSMGATLKSPVGENPLPDFRKQRVCGA
jgi:hypothetical protein